MKERLVTCNEEDTDGVLSVLLSKYTHGNSGRQRVNRCVIHCVHPSRSAQYTKYTAYTPGNESGYGLSSVRIANGYPLASRQL